MLLWFILSLFSLFQCGFFHRQLILDFLQFLLLLVNLGLLSLGLCLGLGISLGILVGRVLIFGSGELFRVVILFRCLGGRVRCLGSRSDSRLPLTGLLDLDLDTGKDQDLLHLFNLLHFVFVLVNLKIQLNSN